MYKANKLIGFRVIATLVATALLFWGLGVHMFTNVAQADNLTSISDTLSDSAPNVVSNHTIVFTIPNGMLTGEDFTITYPAGFNLTGLTEDDVDILVDGSSSSTAGASGAGTWAVGFSGQDITFTTPTDAGVASGTVITIRIGDNAVDFGAGANQITNPSATSSYEIAVAGTMQDSGKTRVAIIENVLVTAVVDTTLTFEVHGTSTGATVNGSPTTTATNTTNLSLPFETLTAGTSKTLAQDLYLWTNAANGFVVTIEQDGNLRSSTLADIDGFIDGGYDDTPQSWVSPSNNILDENTWGHWGLTTTDADLVGNGTDIGSDQWISASTTPRAIFAHDDPADGTTLGIGRATVGFQVEITALQEAGDDYQAVLTYIATPTF